MDILQIIEKKKLGKALSSSETDFIARGAADGSIPDYQLAALLMAIRLRGMNAEETLALTRSMADSGGQTDVSGISGLLCDKHSTGGVSDSTTLILVPALAAMGLKVLKASGRGLGFTGGTIDKLECIPGIKTEFTTEERNSIIEACGAVIMSAGSTLAPADKRLYALRDVTATVDSLPLIASSVMSKKLAGGSHVLLLDVKYGSGAFMKTRSKALELSKLMAGIGAGAGRRTACLVSSMQQPLTPYIGCNLEMKAALGVLRAQEQALKTPLYAVTHELARRMAELAGIEDGGKLFERAILSGAAFESFCSMAKLQGGDISVLENPEKLKNAPHTLEVISQSSGFVSAIDSMLVGMSCVALGGGREDKDSKIDLGAGLVYSPEIGGEIEHGQVVATLYTSKPERLERAAELVEKSYKLSSRRKKPAPLFYAYADGKGNVQYY